MSAGIPRTALVVGGFGDIGSAVSQTLSDAGDRVLRTSRTHRPDAPDCLVLDETRLSDLPVLDVVCWAHGVNVNDAADSFTDQDLLATLDVNVVSVARQIRGLAVAGRLRDGAALVVVSSVWEQIARPGKFSYTVSKAALGGLVRAAAMDLAPRGVTVNAVLPGVVDTPMTRTMLTTAQRAAVRGASGHARLVTAAEVAAAVVMLLSARGVTGQSVVVDLGFSGGRIL